MSQSDKRRHLIIPDTQVKPGVPLEHMDWAGQAIVEYKPDVIIVIGDFWDMHSLSSHDVPGSILMEGTRIVDDIMAGNAAWRRLFAPMEKEMARRTRGKRRKWTPERHFLFGNHEHRLTRALAQEPKWLGVIDLEMLETPGFERHEFLKIVEIDKIKYCHYFPNPLSGRPIGGTIPNRLNHIGSSFVQGHQQGFLYASKQYPDHVKHGIVCGRFYQHTEDYRPADVQRVEWNGIVVLNEVENGNFDLMPLSMSYLERKYG